MKMKKTAALNVFLFYGHYNYQDMQ